MKQYRVTHRNLYSPEERERFLKFLKEKGVDVDDDYIDEQTF